MNFYNWLTYKTPVCLGSKYILNSKGKLPDSILVDAGNRNYSTSLRAQDDLAKTLFSDINKQVIQKLGLIYQPVHTNGNKYYADETFDIDVEANMDLRYADDCRWDVFNMMIEAFIKHYKEKIIKFIESENLTNMYCDSGVHVDINIHRQRRMGFYSWIEMVK